MKTHKNHLRLLILLLLVLLACVGYMTVGVHFENQKLFAYAMRIRTPKLIAMLITAFAIGSASILMKKISRRSFLTAMAAVSAAGVLAACGASSSTASSVASSVAASSETAASSEAAPESVTIKAFNGAKELVDVEVPFDP